MPALTDFCEYCNGPLSDRERSVTVFRHRKGKHFIFEGVRARVCRRCGERYFSAQVAREMDRVMAGRKPAAATVAVPLISMDRGSV